MSTANEVSVTRKGSRGISRTNAGTLPHSTTEVIIVTVAVVKPSFTSLDLSLVYDTGPPHHLQTTTKGELTSELEARVCSTPLYTTTIRLTDSPRTRKTTDQNGCTTFTDRSRHRNSTHTTPDSTGILPITNVQCDLSVTLAEMHLSITNSSVINKFHSGKLMEFLHKVLDIATHQRVR